MPTEILIRGARLHNLQNVTVSIPRNRLVVLTGLSGSGKSTLGFDILLKEGQRQYLESLGLVTFGAARPPVEAISGLSPTIAVDQHLTNHSPRSTVGTVTEVFTYLRLLFARAGHRPCPSCGADVPPATHAILALDAEADADDPAATFPCPTCGAPVAELSMASFSFNKPAGACPTCTGLGSVHQAHLPALIDESRSLAGGAVLEWNAAFLEYNLKVLRAAADYYGLAWEPDQPVAEWAPAARDLLYYGAESPQFRRHRPGVEPPAQVLKGRFEGVATALLRRYAGRISEPEYREKMQAFLRVDTCPDCAGTRLNPAARSVRVAGADIVSLSRRALTELGEWVGDLPAALTPDEAAVAEPVLADLRERIARLVEVGAGYLTLERSSPSLSAGEAQRLRLASLLGSGLTGVLYIFDEPTIGLHQRDTRRLIEVLRRLRDLENTVLVIEHDLDVIAAADHVIDFGPGAGRHGGRIVAAGTPAEVAAAPESLTGGYLAGRLRLPAPTVRRSPGTAALTVRGARHHNLKNLDVRFPLGLLVAVTGVSGSGKSSLVFDVLERALARRLTRSTETPGEHDAIEGSEAIDRLVTVDQAHVIRLPRSNAATYSDAFTPIREAFAAGEDARRLGLTARHFSFNVPGGRCERCQGAGVLAVTMHFLPPVDLRCPVCQGRRFTPEVLQARYHGADIAQVLEMTVEEALGLFREVPAARSRLQALADVGLGYLQLGQPADTLSGGEAQRVKLAKELGRRGSGRTLYLLDEPTIGLHLADVARLLGVLQRLVDAGSSVIVVEHNLELVKTADWVIDLGPEGGSAGGYLLAEGTPEQIAAVPGSVTGKHLREIL